MRAFLPIALCCLFAGGAVAQGRGGAGGHGGGGFSGWTGGSGSFRSGFGGGSFRSGFENFRDENGRLNRSGFSVFNAGFRSASYGGYGGYGGYYSPYGYSGFGYGWPGDYGFGFPYNSFSYTEPGYSAYHPYNPSPSVTLVYPSQAQSEPVYVSRATPVTHEYDRSGQEIPKSGSGGATGAASPIYLVAFQDHVIRAAAAYWVDGKTLHYVNLQHEEKQAPLESVDRTLSMQLNRERQVQFQLPQ